MILAVIVAVLALALASLCALADGALLWVPPICRPMDIPASSAAAKIRGNDRGAKPSASCA